MPPVHPAVVHLPIALVVLSVTADLVGSWARRTSLQAAGFWSLIAAAVTAGLAVATGYYDMNRASLSAEADGLVHLHMRIGWLVLVATAALALWRWWLWRRRAAGLPLGPVYSIAAILLLGLVAFQAWYGGEMVYAYGTSVAATGQGVEAADSGKRRLRTVYEALRAPGGMGHDGQGTGRTATGHSNEPKPAPHRH